jgi:hypothetical protein
MMRIGKGNNQLRESGGSEGKNRCCPGVDSDVSRTRKEMRWLMFRMWDILTMRYGCLYNSQGMIRALAFNQSKLRC